MAITASSSACIARPQSVHLLRRGGVGSGRLAAAVQQRHRRRQQPMAALPAEASEVVSDVMQAMPDVVAGPSAAAALPAAGDALAAAQAAVESDPTDLIFTALFTIAIAALSVVTLGVAYLSFTSWNDSRTEASDRARFDGSSFRPSGSGSAPGKKAKAAAANKPEEYKGFGKK